MKKINTTFLKNKILSSFIWSLAICLCAACKFQPNIQGKGAPFLYGIWQEQEDAFHKDLLNYTEYKFKFICDSFYVDLTTHSKVNYYTDDCYHDGIWKEYAKGNYVLQGDTLYLIGTFTKENYKQKISGCYRIGQYLQKFIVSKKENDQLTFVNLTDAQKINLHLKQKLHCVPKPL